MGAHITPELSGFQYLNGNYARPLPCPCLSGSLSADGGRVSPLIEVVFHPIAGRPCTPYTSCSDKSNFIKRINLHEGN